MAQVFISYSHRDNREIDGSRWVSNFQQNLSIVVEQLDGRGCISAWSDDQWRTAHSLEGGLPAILAKTEVLLSILSPSYAYSRWCKRELEWFTSRFGGRSENRVIAAEFRPGAHDLLNEILKGLVPIRFWKGSGVDGKGTPRPLNWPKASNRDSDDYWAAMNALGHEILIRLKELAGRETTTQPRKVWIAAPSDDQRANVRSLEGHLKQAGCIIVRTDAALRTELGADAENALAALLEGVDVFVQCFGYFAGAEFDDLGESVSVLQFRVAHQIADVTNRPFLAWRPPELRLNDLTDTAYLSRPGTSFGRFLNKSGDLARQDLRASSGVRWSRARCGMRVL